LATLVTGISISVYMAALNKIGEDSTVAELRRELEAFIELLPHVSEERQERVEHLIAEIHERLKAAEVNAGHAKLRRVK
jgi:tRNA uridine 5-carbamoylmethylation protein Kti12